MKFLFMCGREVDYTRNQVLLRALKKLGPVETIVETGVAKSLIMRSLRISIRALPHLISGSFDLVFVGFYGHLLMLPAGLFSRRPVVFDAFVSTYDTLITDRLLYSPNSWIGRLSEWLDHTACYLADRVVVDTPSQVNYFSSALSISPEKMASLPVACDEEIFFPRQNSPLQKPRTLALSYSTYLPIHGIETVINAAELLRDEPIDFKLIGNGPLYQKVVNTADRFGLRNLTFSPPVSLQRLADEIAISDICLGGHFGTSDKAGRVIPGKIYQMLAMGKPVIAADTPANRSLMEHRVSAYLCSAGDARALADAIRELLYDPMLRERLGAAGREAYEMHGSEKIVAEGLRQLVQELVGEDGHNSGVQ
jgi:glycosyltransferase involved in cell wall biosynthesis